MLRFVRRNARPVTRQIDDILLASSPVKSCWQTTVQPFSSRKRFVIFNARIRPSPNNVGRHNAQGEALLERDITLLVLPVTNHDASDR
jgi:hypothetical protein